MPDSHKVLANGLEQHVLEWPSRGPAPGPTVLLLHGYMDAAATWQPVAPALTAEGFRVLAPDLRGYGDGARVPAGGYYHFADYVFDVADLVDQLVPAGSPLIVVGHSMGGTIANMYMPRRRAQPALQLLVRPDRTTGCPGSRRSPICCLLPGHAKEIGLASASGSRSRGDRGRVTTTGPPMELALRGGDGTESTEELRRGGVCGGAAQPAVLSRHSRVTSGIRGTFVPLGRVGRTVELAGRRVAVSGPGPALRNSCPAGGRGGAPRRVPADAAVAAADRELRRPVSAGVPRALGPVAGVRTVGPAVAVLDHARGTARAPPGSTPNGTRTPRRSARATTSCARC